MTKNVTNLLGILITIIAGTYFYINHCSSCRAPIEKTEVKPPPKITNYPFTITDGNYSYHSNDNYNFNNSSSAILMPIAPKIGEGIKSLQHYLEQHPNQIVTITGLYKTDETNNSAFPNLGIARANTVKNHLVSNGLSSAQIITNGSIKEEMIADKDTYLGPVSFVIKPRSADAIAKLKALHSNLTENPLILQFNSAETSINLTPEQRQKVAGISRYLDQVKDAKVIITGHTDGSGNRLSNIKIGQKRADFGKEYLVKNGISTDRIAATSKGPDAPIASNKTEEGRAQNRRTVITLNEPLTKIKQ